MRNILDEPYPVRLELRLGKEETENTVKEIRNVQIYKIIHSRLCQGIQ